MKAVEILEQVADRWAARDGYDPGSAVYLKDTRFMARTIAEELGITAEMVDEVMKSALELCCSDTKEAADALSVLLAMGEER